jgi:histidinol-phosphatase
MHDLERERLFLLDLRSTTRPIVLGHYRNVAIETKHDGTDVTAADRLTEQAIRERLADAFPGDAVLGEELGGASEPRSGRCWVLDPIDGTTWYTLGVPFFSTLIALLEDGEPVLGMADLPALDETYLGVRGGGAWFQAGAGNAQRLHVRAPLPLGEAFGSASGIHDTTLAPAGERIAIDLAALTRDCRRFRFCGDALQHMLVARGALDLALDQRMSPWDSAALVPIVEEAGGAVCDLGGRRRDVVFGGSLLSASHPGLLEEALVRLTRS